MYVYNSLFYELGARLGSKKLFARKIAVFLKWKEKNWVMWKAFKANEH